MKKIFLLLLASVSLFSCSDEEVLNDGSKLNNGGFARFQDNVVQTIDYKAGAGKLEYTVVDPNANAVKYRIYGIVGVFNGLSVPAQTPNTPINYIPANFVYEGFPAKVSISLQQLADVFAAEGVTLADITYGTSFKILAEVTTNTGQVFKGESTPTTNLGATQTNTSVDLLNTSFGYKQAMQFSVTVACPSYDAASMLGTYKVTNDAFEEYSVFTPANYTVQCVAGNSPNQIKFINFSNVGTDLVVDINAAAQTVTSPRVKMYNNFYTFGSCFAEGASGLVFSCTGTVDLNMKYSFVRADGTSGSFTGAWNLRFTKQ